MCVWETAVVICSGLWVPLLHTWHRSHAWGSSRQCQDKKPDCWLNTAMHSGSLKALECESSSDLLQPTSLANRRNTRGQLCASLPPPDSLNFHFATNLSRHSSDDNQRTKLRLFKKTHQTLLFLSHLLATEWYFIFDCCFPNLRVGGVHGLYFSLPPGGNQDVFLLGSSYFILSNIHLMLFGPQNVL